MCIGCRGRFNQKLLNRFKCEKSKVISYNGFGRSFYICEKCIKDKNIDKKIFRVCKNNKIDVTTLREIVNI